MQRFRELAFYISIDISAGLILYKPGVLYFPSGITLKRFDILATVPCFKKAILSPEYLLVKEMLDLMFKEF